MKKISTLFRVEYHKKGDPGTIHNEVRPENAWVFDDRENVIATVKFDGTATMIKDGVFYKRYDAKNGKVPPANAIPCIPEPDPISTHWPHWLPVDFNNNENKYLIEAFDSTLPDGTYELCGEKVGINAEKIVGHKLLKHGSVIAELPEWSFDGIKQYLADPENDVEGIVFHHTDGRMTKIRKSDFRFKRK